MLTSSKNVKYICSPAVWFRFGDYQNGPFGTGETNLEKKLQRYGVQDIRVGILYIELPLTVQLLCDWLDKRKLNKFPISDLKFSQKVPVMEKCFEGWENTQTVAKV